MKRFTRRRPGFIVPSAGSGFVPAPGTITDASIQQFAGIQASKVQQQRVKVYEQESATTAVSESRACTSSASMLSTFVSAFQS